MARDQCQTPAMQERIEGIQRNAFDRFGNDLSELVLGYLPISDAFRFENMSKSIQSIIFNKHNKLVISEEQYNLTERLAHHPIRKGANWGYTPHWRLNNARLEQMLTKLTQLTTIEITGDIRIDSGIFEILAKKCFYLKNLAFNEMVEAYRVSPECAKRFGSKCGHRLESLKFGDNFEPEFILELIKSAPKIRNLHVENLEQLLKEKSSELLLLMPRIKALSFTSRQGKYFNKSGVILSGTNTKIEAEITFYTFELKEPLEQVVAQYALENLTCLKISFTYLNPGEIKRVHKGMEIIVNKCRSLTDLSVHIHSIHCSCDYKLNFLQLFATLDKLKKLSFTVIGSFTEFSHGTLRDLKPLKSLKKLKLRSPYLGDQDFKDINANLPGLCDAEFITAGGLTDIALEHLRKLTHLSSLRLKIYCRQVLQEEPPEEARITDAGLKILIQQNINLKRIRLEGNHKRPFNLTRETLHCLVHRAQENPKVVYSFLIQPGFWAHTQEPEDREKFLAAVKHLPSNLVVMY